MDTLLHTPDGVRDIYNEECKKRNILSDRLKETLNLYGYQDIQTPSFEFFDIFNRERGSVSSRNMYKFFDREGNTLVLRPDITPSIARAVAKYYMDESIPLRFAYSGNTFINNQGLQGRMSETTQIGAELVMDNSLEGDAEIISLAIQMLLEAGLTQFQIDIGHVDFFRIIAQSAGLNEDEITELKGLINEKKYFAVNMFVNDKGISGEIKGILEKLPELFGSSDVISRARELCFDQKALEVLDYLDRLYGLIQEYGFEKYVTIDLGMLSEYNYYTGIVFKAYTYGSGDAIIKGGRYDKLISQFGKDAASIGFVILLDELMISLRRQGIEISDDSSQIMILYDIDMYTSAVKKAARLRAEKKSVCMMRMEKSVDEYIDYCRRYNIDRIIYMGDKTEEIMI